MTTVLSLEKVCKRFGNVIAVEDFNLEVEKGEFIVLVGPSGCGKTTNLRMVAGLEVPSKGIIRIEGRVVNDIPPKDRKIAMVFQNYALYGHMNVYENVSFGLRIQKTPKQDIEERVKKVASILGLSDLLNRKPRELSGGQRQRVALGRAIIRDPVLFLFDEPLSNLDAKLRTHMRVELKRLHKALGATIMYVTHDQTEAMTLGDRIVVMKDGLIQQIGSPLELYNMPQNIFVGGFIGVPTMNFKKARLTAKEGVIRAETESICIQINKPTKGFLRECIGKEVILGIRPEDIDVVYEGERSNAINQYDAIVDLAEPLGGETLLYVKINGGELTIKTKGSFEQSIQKTKIRIPEEKVHVFNLETEQNIVSIAQTKKICARENPETKEVITSAINDFKT